MLWERKNRVELPWNDSKETHLFWLSFLGCEIMKITASEIFWKPVKPAYVHTDWEGC